ncbi:MAG: hypothetical protein Q7T53_10060 [Deltaproteobacteria bacterium]|nr:hypothetical protein [Deltaproteobacteria bacterium]
MEKLVKLTLSPFSPNIEVVDKMVMKVHVPYSEEMVTMQFNPNIQDYKEQDDKPGIKVRQTTFSTSTAQTTTVPFDFKANNIQDIFVENTKYTVKLMTIGKELIQGQNFLYFDFFVTWA